MGYVRMDIETDRSHFVLDHIFQISFFLSQPDHRPSIAYLTAAGMPSPQAQLLYQTSSFSCNQDCGTGTDDGYTGLRRGLLTTEVPPHLQHHSAPQIGHEFPNGVLFQAAALDIPLPNFEGSYSWKSLPRTTPLF
jgi:hypothetical protein